MTAERPTIMIVANMVPIGGAANGDPLVICFRCDSHITTRWTGAAGREVIAHFQLRIVDLIRASDVGRLLEQNRK